MGNINIKEIARECNVSIATVSRALNGSKEISEKTKKHILEVCKDKKYIPNSAARSLILKETKMVGLIIPDITNQFYSCVSKGISQYIDKYNYGLILCNSNKSETCEKKYIDFLLQGKVDGVIIIPTQRTKKNYDKLIEHKMPFVFVDNYINDVDVSYIGNDNYAGGRKIISHMVKQGYRTIGVILGNEKSTASNERLKAYKDIFIENNIEINKDILIHSNAIFEDGYSLAKQLIEKGVDSIFAINDTVAMGVLKYCYDEGIKIPEDIGVAGYDDIEQSSMLPIPLTTVHQNKFVLGNKAAEVLINEINKNCSTKQKVILQPELIIRKSCKE